MKFFFSTIIFLSLFKMSLAQKIDYNLLVGAYTNTGMAKGIYTYQFDTKTGGSTQTQEINSTNPSFLALSRDEKFLYAVNESGKTSTVSAFKYDKKTNKLTFLNKVASAGTDPCYITVDEKHVFVANYSSGSLAVFNRNKNGTLTEVAQLIQHTGNSIDPKGRQKSAHVHMGIFSTDKRYLIINDLGEDKVYTYNYHPEAKQEILTPHSVFQTVLGTGPRHIVFGKDGKFAYLVHEFNGEIAVLAFADGKFNKIEDVITTKEDFSGAVDGAEIVVSADGKFLYESNRGDANTISVFSIKKDGKLSLVEIISTLGKGPRNFVIDPTGNYLLIGHQYTKEIVVFKRDKSTGKLTDSGKRIDVGAAVCLIFAN